MSYRELGKHHGTVHGWLLVQLRWHGGCPLLTVGYRW